MDHKFERVVTELSELSEEIGNLKVTMEKNRLELKHKTVAQNRLEMKKDLVNFQTGLTSIVEGENSGNIFGLPNEIWELVFENLDDTTDIQNCYNTCQQFRSCCGSNQKTLIQIKKILPILLPTGYLTHNQILNLRLTSKPISKCIDQYLQSKKLSWKNSLAPMEYDLISFCYNFSSSGIFMHESVYNVSKGRVNVLYQFLTHPQTRNPFLSRYLMIHDDASDNRWHDQVVEFLKCWGKQIWYLTFELNCTKRRFLEILQLMPNLRHLNITGRIIDDEDVSLNIYNIFLRESCPKLTSLVFPATPKFILAVHNNLTSRFSAQIIELHVESWTSMFSEFKWPNLRKLVVANVNLLTDLCFCSANNLEELNLCLNGNENIDLFLKVTNKFPKLEVLKVNFGKEFEMSDIQVMEKLLQNNGNDEGCVKVKRLSLKMKSCDKIGLSILAWFPMLEYLEIEKKFEEKFEKKSKPVLVYYTLEDMFKEIEQASVDDMKENAELVEIERYLSKNRNANLDKSNVWKLLPFLKQIKISNLTFYTVKVFTKPF